MYISLPDRSASSSSNSLGRASGLAPALEIDTQAVNVVDAFLFADTFAVVVVDQCPARPFIVAAQVMGARIIPNRRIHPGSRDDEQEKDGREVLP